MKKLACLLIITLTPLASCLLVGNVHAFTSVNGLIASNTTWDSAHSPYELTGPVGVEAGATLTIEPGVVVNFAGHYIEVNGTINAEGTSTNDITFTSSVNPSAAAQLQVIQFDCFSGGGIIANASFNVIAVFINGGSPEINGNTFNDPGTNAIDIWGGSPLILNNVVNSGSTDHCGIVAHSNPTVSNNLVNGGMYGIYAQGSGYISNNIVVGGEISVSLDWQASFVGNTVINGTGILCGTSGAVEQNYICNNTCGITGSGNIEDNTIVDNQVGLSLDGPSTLTGNNIYGNTQNNVVLTSSDNINASNNWWGTTDIQAINQTIHDFKNDFNLGVVTFTPILTQPSSSAPSSTRTSLSSSLISTLPITTPENSPSPTETSQPSQTGSLNQNPTASPLQPLGESINSLGGSSFSQVEAAAGVIAVALLLAVLIIVVIRKRTLTQKVPARKTRTRRARRRPSSQGV